MNTAPTALRAGAAEANITPAGSVFLFGYPFVARDSTGVHDPLLASALYLDDGQTQLITVANDIIWVPRPVVQRARQRIAAATGVPADHVMITATHTHSGPVTANMLSNKTDPVVPKADPAYVQKLEDGIVQAAVDAANAARPARLETAVADGSGLGTNRRHPDGPAIPEVPVLAVREADGDGFIALMAVVYMHPTVLHEDSTLISGDFPGLARRDLKQRVIGNDCPFVYHMGSSGNQSPRHVTRANTFAEADRLGQLLGRAIEAALADAEELSDVTLACRSTHVELPMREFPDVADAEAQLDAVKQRLADLRKNNAPRTEVRTAECDWFGAEETVTLARAAADGELEAAARTCMPAEVQVMRVGPWRFVGWPGEVFVEFAQAVLNECERCAIITLANGGLQGYIVTAQAVAEGSYEAGNAVFKSPESGDLLVNATLALLREEQAPAGSQA